MVHRQGNAGGSGANQPGGKQKQLYCQGVQAVAQQNQEKAENPSEIVSTHGLNSFPKARQPEADGRCSQYSGKNRASQWEKLAIWLDFRTSRRRIEDIGKNVHIWTIYFPQEKWYNEPQYPKGGNKCAAILKN